MDKQYAYAGLIATISVICEQCRHSYTYEQQIVKMTTAVNREEAKSKVAEELRRLESSWRRGSFIGIKAKPCPSCKHYQSWMEKSKSQADGSFIRRLSNLLGYKQDTQLAGEGSIPVAKCRNPIFIKTRPIPNDLLVYTDFELSFLFGYKNKEKIIFQSLRHRSLDQVIQILDGSYTDEFDILINELKETPDVMDRVILHYIPILLNSKNRWDWGENTLGEMVRIYPDMQQGNHAAHILSAIGEPAIEQLCSILEEAVNKLESDFTNELIIVLTVEALGRIKSKTEKTIPALIEALGMVEKCSSEVSRYNSSPIYRVLEEITQVYDLASHQEWWAWWQSKGQDLHTLAGEYKQTDIGSA
jgi:hypothetical protein